MIVCTARLDWSSNNKQDITKLNWILQLVFSSRSDAQSFSF